MSKTLKKCTNIKDCKGNLIFVGDKVIYNYRSLFNNSYHTGTIEISSYDPKHGLSPYCWRDDNNMGLAMREMHENNSVFFEKV